MIARVLPLLLLMALPAWAGLEVSVEGLSGDLRDNVLLRLSIEDARARKDLDEVSVQRLHEQATGDIRAALQPFGHYNPVIEASLSGSAPDWQARYAIQPGPQTRLTAVEIEVVGEGVDFAPLAAARADLSLKPDTALNHASYEAAKARLQQLAFNEGFLDARYTSAELRVVPEENRAEVHWTLDTGPRWFFGPITLNTQGLREDFLRRYLRVQEGQPYSPQQVLDTQFALSDLDYFQTVEPTPDRTAAVDQRIPLHLATTPRARRKYEAGLGYGTDTGARLTAALETRRVTKRGHKLRGEMRLSEVKNTYGGEYRIPLGIEAGESLSLTGASVSEKFEDGESLKYTLGASLNRTPGSWKRRVYLEYAHEESEIAGASSTSDLLIPGISFTRGEADDPIHTRMGWSVFFDVHGARKELLSESNFLQTRLLARGALPLGNRMRLLGRAEWGMNFPDEFSELPASQRFYAGGDQSVRGYAYQSLGPRNEEGLVIGGKFLSAFSVETEIRVWNHWGAALFVDAGGADDRAGPALSVGAGLGLRYRAPIGTVNLDLAHPFDEEEDREVRVHFSVRVGL